MHLASLKRQKVRVAGETIDFRAGETIHTENSYKYSVESLQRAGARRRLDCRRRSGPTRQDYFARPGFHASRSPSGRRGRSDVSADASSRALSLAARPRRAAVFSRRGIAMKIVGFEDKGSARLGVVEGDQVIDLQAADAKTPADLGEWLRAQWRSQSRSPISPRRRRPPRAVRSPGLKFALPVAQARQDHLPRPELPRPRQGRPAEGQHPEIPVDLFPHADVAGAAPAAADAAEEVDPARLRRRAGRDHRQARQASDAGERHRLHRRLCLRQWKARSASISATPRNGAWARISTRPAASGPGWSRADELPKGGKGLKIETPAQRQDHAVVEHRPVHVPGGGIAGLSDRRHDA